MTRYCSIIVTYNPFASDLHKLLEKHPAWVKVIIVDNSTEVESSEEVKHFAQVYSAKLLGKNKNIGIGAAQNLGISWAIKEKYDCVFLLDDDSVPQDEFFTTMVMASKRANLYDFTCGVQYSQSEKSAKRLAKKHLLMSSGTLCSLKIFDQIGGFDARLFMNYVDYEFGWRAKKYLGSKINISEESIFHHQLGEGDIFGLTIPSCDAQFFHWRNTIYLMKFMHVPLMWKISRVIILPIKTLLVLFLKGQLFRRLNKILHGIACGFLMLFVSADINLEKD